MFKYYTNHHGLSVRILILLLFLSSCQTDPSDIDDVQSYFDDVNQAELLICNEEFAKAAKLYKRAFRSIEKPFGKDVFNAALCNHLGGDIKVRDRYLKLILHNTDDASYVHSVFVNDYISESTWDELISTKQVDYDEELREEFVEIYERDQRFRPMYDTHDDTINANRKLNLSRILAITETNGFPSHLELGYQPDLRGQKHHIVVHHTAQRRSKDKTTMDLEPILLEAVHGGRLDPENAIYYMNFQNDREKGPFEVCSMWQFYHPLLPDSLNQQLWSPDLSPEGISKANEVRRQWYASSIEDIITKANYLSTANRPFIFSSVRRSVVNLSDEFDQQTALEQYNMIASVMKQSQ
ncbi:MAG: hypothetical protein AAFQ02_08030 [Bacteroidota bacterium]